MAAVPETDQDIKASSDLDLVVLLLASFNRVNGELKSWEDRELRHIEIFTVKALGKIRDPRAVNSLVQILQDNTRFSPIIRSIAADSLGVTGCQTAIDPLLRALDDPSPLVRVRAAGALAKRGNFAGLATALQLISSDDMIAAEGRSKPVPVFYAAARILVQLTSDRVTVTSSMVAFLQQHGGEMETEYLYRYLFLLEVFTDPSWPSRSVNPVLLEPLRPLLLAVILGDADKLVKELIKDLLYRLSSTGGTAR